MEMRQLRQFVAVAEELHFGKAARRLNLSQPPLSKSIRLLEEELGAQLFERTSRSVALTREGAYFLDEARAILERTAKAARRVGRMARGLAGTLDIGTIGPVLEGPLPAAIRRFRQANPDVHINLQQMSSRGQVQALKSAELDAGFIRLHGPVDPALAHVLYAEDRYLLAVPEGHPLAGRRSVRLSELSGQNLLLFSRPINPGLYDAITARLHEAGAVPELLHTDLMKHPTGALVAAGLGLALIPGFMTAVPRPGVVHLPIEDELPIVQYGLAWNRADESELLCRFVAAMQDEPGQ